MQIAQMKAQQDAATRKLTDEASLRDLWRRSQTPGSSSPEDPGSGLGMVQQPVGFDKTGYIRGLGNINPDKAFESMQKPDATVALGDDQGLFDKTTNQWLVKPKPKTEKPHPMVAAIEARYGAGTPESIKAIDAWIGTQTTDQAPSMVREYEAAKAQGFKGTLLDFMKARATNVHVAAPQRERIVYDPTRGGTVNLDTGEFTPATVGGKAIAPKPTAVEQKTKIAQAQTVRDLDRAIVELTKASQDGGLIDQSTGSGAGALVDIGAGFFGSATPGAIAVGRMKPIYDLALKMVPRFEGPQSDKDTRLYENAAGDLGNPAVPNARKKAAAKEIVRLMKERRGQFVDKANVGTEAGMPPGMPKVSSDAEYEALPSGTEYIAPDGSTRKKK